MVKWLVYVAAWAALGTIAAVGFLAPSGDKAPAQPQLQPITRFTSLPALKRHFHFGTVVRKGKNVDAYTAGGSFVDLACYIYRNGAKFIVEVCFEEKGVNRGVPLVPLIN